MAYGLTIPYFAHLVHVCVRDKWYNLVMLFGTDQSAWQPDLVTEGDFIIMKATEGCGYVDASCDTKYQMNKVAGKLLGVYHFARPDLNSAEDEAVFFVDNIRGYLREAILVLDWEQPGTQRMTAWAKAWLDKVFELTGVKPLIYMSASVIRENNWSDVVVGDYGLWVAGYPDLRNSFDLPDFNYDISPWPFYALWQFTNSGGSLDRDAFMGDKEAWLKYAGAITAEEAKKNEEPKAVEESKKNEGPKSVEKSKVVIPESALREYDVLLDEQMLEIKAPRRKRSIKVKIIE